MHATKLIESLEAYLVRFKHDISEVQNAQNFIKFVNEQQNCFLRMNLIGHATGSAWLINKEGDHALLTHHKKLNTWLQLGGHADRNDNLLEVAICEAQEESGILDIEVMMEDIFDIDIHDIPAYGKEPKHKHFDARFLLRVISNAPLIVSDESHDLKWCHMSDSIWDRLDISVSRMAKKWQKFQHTIESTVSSFRISSEH